MNGQKLEELQRTPKKDPEEGHTFNKFGSQPTISPYFY